MSRNPLAVLARSVPDLLSHKLRGLLTLILLMLGVFALVLMTSLLDGLKDTIRAQFEGISWDGTLALAPRPPLDPVEQKRFAQSSGLCLEDVPRLAEPDERIMAFLPMASREARVALPSGTELIPVSGQVPDYLAVMNRKIRLGRGLTPEDQRTHATVAVLGARFAARFLGGADPVGRSVAVDGVPFQVVGVLAPMLVSSDDTWLDSNGILVPLEAYMDRLEPSHKLNLFGVKLRSQKDMAAVTGLMLGRVRRAHHGMDDVEVMDLDAVKARSLVVLRGQIRGWTRVLLSLAGTVLLVGGIGVLSVMLISLSERRYEIGLRKALGATDGELLLAFLFEAALLAALGALGGTLAGAAACAALSAHFPFGLVLNRQGLALAWTTALALGLGFGLYPAIQAMRLSPMEAMQR